jgi:adenylate cyclase
MGIEIERKFLLADNSWMADADNGTRFCQGYLCETGPGSVRVRIEGDQANINVKSATIDMHRFEYEYSIPLTDAEQMLESLCIKPLIEKTRYHVEYGGKLWEVDVFKGDNEGLCVAEVELDSREEAIALPDWVAEEVTNDKRYYNVCLVSHPYKDW